MTVAVRAPASSANLGAGFDVFGMALDLTAEVGDGEPPDGAHVIQGDHPLVRCHRAAGGRGDIWLRTDIPMGRGLGFSGAARVAAAGLANAQRGDDPVDVSVRSEILEVAVAEEGHGDNAAASVHGGVVAYVDGRVVPFPVGDRLGAARVVAWVSDATVSTDRSRAVLGESVLRSDATHNLGRVSQFVLAFAHDDPDLLAGSTDDAMHQPERLPTIPGATEALEAGVGAGAWCGWLSGSGPTVAFLVAADRVDAVRDALPDGAHTKVLALDRAGVRTV